NACGARSLFTSRAVRRTVRHLFSGPDVFVAHDLAFAVASPGADDRQLNVPPAASLRHDLTDTGPLKTGDRPVSRRGRIAITDKRPFVVPRCAYIPDDRQIVNWSPAQLFARIAKIGLPFRRRFAHDRA